MGTDEEVPDTVDARGLTYSSDWRRLLRNSSFSSSEFWPWNRCVLNSRARSSFPGEQGTSLEKARSRFPLFVLPMMKRVTGQQTKKRLRGLTFSYLQLRTPVGRCSQHEKLDLASLMPASRRAKSTGVFKTSHYLSHIFWDPNNPFISEFCIWLFIINSVCIVSHSESKS